MGPSTPRCSSQSCAVFVSVLLLGFWMLFGKFKMVCCFGTLIQFRLPFKLRPCKVLCLLCFGVPGWGCIVTTTVSFRMTKDRRTD